MPVFSKLSSLFSIALALHYVSATVVVPYVLYWGFGEIGVSNEFVRFPGKSNEGFGNTLQARRGVRVAIGDPPQHVWLLPNFADSETYVNNATVCDGSPSEGDFMCEQLHSGLFAANESTTWRPIGMGSGEDRVSLPGSFPAAGANDLLINVFNGTEQGYLGGLYGTVGLGPDSKFIKQIFDTDEKHIGIYFPGPNGTSTNLPYADPPNPSGLPNPQIIYELEFEGYNESHFKGERHTQPIPRGPSGIEQFKLEVSGLTIGGMDVLGGEKYNATVDLIGLFDSFPRRVMRNIANVTNAINATSLSLQYQNSSLPTDPSKAWDLEISFSNGHKVKVVQDLAFYEGPDDFAYSAFLDAENPDGNQPYEGPIISLGSLIFSSYIGIDWEKDEWWIAQSTRPGADSAAQGVGSHMNKIVLYVASIAAAFVLFA